MSFFGGLRGTSQTREPGCSPGRPSWVDGSSRWAEGRASPPDRADGVRVATWSVVERRGQWSRPYEAARDWIVGAPVTGASSSSARYATSNRVVSFKRANHRCP